MTSLNNLLRRLVALLLCACMLLGNMGVALSDTVDFLSDTFVPANYVSVRSSAPGDTVSLSEYAELNYTLSVDREGTPPPAVLEDGQFLLLRLAFKLKEQEGLEGLYLLRQAYREGLVDENTTFTVDMDFMNLLNDAKYPTSYEDDDNIASHNGVELFRWWVDKASGKICLRIYKKVYEDNGIISNTSVALEGTLDASGRDNNGELHFGVDGTSSSLKVRQDYELAKAAGVPYFSTDASSYLVDYTVTLKLKQDMKLSDSAAATADLYSAALTLVDTVQANGALKGEIYGDPVVTAPEGESASVTMTRNGTTNTLTFASEDQILKQGTYTIVYKMKLDSAAALAKLKNYTDEQKKNTVEVKENGASLPTPLTADATIAWNNVTEDQYKIDKNAFTEKAPHFKGVYLDEVNQKYYIDFRVVVYIREEVSTFTVTDHADYALTFQGAPAPTLEGVDTSETYWTNDVNTVTLTPLTGEAAPTVESYINDAKELVTTITAPAGGKLQPGAYHLRVPADVTEAVRKTLEKTYPQSYQNTVHLTSVDGETTQESKMFKQAIPNRTEPRKDGGFVVENGQVKLHNGKPVIRWDVWFGWDFYDTTTFVDTMTGMELLIDSTYPFEIHSFTDMNDHKGTLASLNSKEDKKNNSNELYLDFNDAGTGFTFYADKLDKNSDNTPVKLYKLVYFTTPVSNADGTYQTNGLENGYTITHKDPFGNGFSNPGSGTVVPGLTGNALLSVNKLPLNEVNDLITSWKITVSNANDIPFSQLGHLEILDVVPTPDKQGTNGDIGEVTVYYGDDFPISVYMTMPQNKSATLVEGTHYTISRDHSEYNLGDDGKYGFVVSLKMAEVAALLAENGVDHFETIQVTSYLQNERHGGDKNYRIYNEGHIDYSNLEVELHDSHSKHYDRSFSTLNKGVLEKYGDYYDPAAYREFIVCTADGRNRQSFTGGYDNEPADGDGLKEFMWRISIDAPEFENSNAPIRVTVTDTLAEGLVFPSYEGKDPKELFRIDAGNVKDHILLPDNVTFSGNTFTLTFTVPGGYWASDEKGTNTLVYVWYHTHVKPEFIKDALDKASDDASSIKLSFDNKATVSWNGVSGDTPTSTGSATFSTIMLDKTSEIVTAVSEIEYSILINEDRLPLNGGEPLVLTDTLGEGKEGFLYRDDSVRLVNLDTGEALTAGSTVSDSTYTITWATGDTKGFTIQVPDGQRLQLTYRVKPQAAVGNETGDLINSASLDGQVSSHTRDSFKVSASNQEGSYQIPENTVVVNIMKKEGDVSIIVPLQGAVFAAYPVHADGTLGAEVKTCTTVADGSASFEFERDAGIDGYGTVYCIKEKTAPVGYHLTDDEWYFYFSMPDKEYANDEVKTIVEKLKADGKKVYNVLNEKSYLLNVEDLPITSDLRIYKASSTGESLTGAVFALQDANGNQMPAPTVSDGCYTFADLKGGTYTLTETKAPDGYQLSTPNSWTIQLAAGSDGEANTVSVVWPEDATDAMKAYVVEMSGETVPSLTVVNDAADDAALQIPVTKKLVGAETTEQEFTFTMEAVTKNAPMPTSTTASTADAAYTEGETEVLFGEITYPYACVGNTYEYKITENQVNASTGFTGDASEYHVTVSVEWKDGQVVASIQSITKDGEEAEKVAFTNAYVPYTSVTVTKVWEDDGDKDGMRDGVNASVVLMKTVGTTTVQVGEAVAVGTTDDWSKTWSELPVYDGDKAISYSVKEVLTTANGYTSDASTAVAVENGGTVEITNRYTSETTSATVKKVWDDEENQDGKRPTSLTVTLSNGDTVTLNKDNKWEATIDNLPKYADGEEIVYTWSEDEEGLPEGYKLTKTEEDGTITTLTNSYTPEETSITVNKKWDDNNNQDGKRSGVVAKVTLMKTVDGATSDVETVTVGAGDDWSKTWDKLPVYAGGKAITYSVVETLETANGYTSDTTAAVVVANGGSKTITNKYTPEVTSITVNKNWSDNSNQDGKRSGVVASVKLYKKVGETTTELYSEFVGVADNWSKTWNGLPVYENGQKIAYSVKEELTEANGYESDTTEAVVVANGGTKTITNSYTPEVTSITVNKKWDDNNNQDGKRSGVVAKVTLMKTVDDVTEDVETVQVTEADDWSKKWEKLPVNAGGKAITYSVKEVLETPNGYESDTTEAVVVANGGSKTITNSYTPEVTSITVNKIWSDNNDQDGKRSGVVASVALMKTVGTATEQVGEAVAVGSADNWSNTWNNLPVYEGGNAITYSVIETLETANGYTSDTTTATTVVNNGSAIITNTHTPATVEVTGSKVWIDLNNAYQTRPESITIRLLADGTEIASQQANAANNWSWSFTELPKYAVGKVGHEITYTVTEDSVPGYVTSQNGYNFTNTVQVVAFQKLDEQTGKPLSGAGFALYEGRLTAAAGTPLMTWTSTSAPKMLAGLTTGKTYTILETKAPFGFTPMTPFVFTVQDTDTPAAMRTFTANNRHSYRFRKLSTSNNELVYGAEMAIMQGDTTIATWFTNYENDGWHYVADKRFKAGVTYTLVELSAPNGYQLASPIAFSIDPNDGFLIVNGQDTNDMSMVMFDQPVPSATPGPEPTTTSFRVTKRWEDQDNVLGLRPSSIVVNLYQKTSNEASYPETPYLTVTMSSDGTDEWDFTFNDLPRRDGNGRLYSYMAQEEPVEGYVASYLNNGRTIVNSIPEEDLPPTPTPTLPYATPTPSPMPRVPTGVQFVDGKWVYVDEYGVPLGIVPLTGDNTNFALWGAAIVLPMIIAALAAVEIRRRKRRMAVEGTEE